MLGIFALFIMLNGVIYFYAYTKAEVRKVPVLLVLGAGIDNNPPRPNQMLKDRLDAAIKYLKQYPKTTVIVSGGQGEDEVVTEASVMKKYLIEHGIHKKRILVEDKSKRTAEQFIYPYQVHPFTDFAVLTSDFHLLRSQLLAKRSGFDDFVMISAPLSSVRERVKMVIREPLALINSFFFDFPLSDQKSIQK